jgi:hypothetical protein
VTALPPPPVDGAPPLDDEHPLRFRSVLGLVALLLILSSVPLVALIIIWPEGGDIGKARTLSTFGASWTLSPEQQILATVGLCGLLGGSIRMLLRIQREFVAPPVRRQFIPWYFLTPPIGAILAVAFYLVVVGDSSLAGQWRMSMYLPSAEPEHSSAFLQMRRSPDSRAPLRVPFRRSRSPPTGPSRGRANQNEGRAVQTRHERRKQADVKVVKMD